MHLQYIFRLDDICPTMDWDNFFRLESVFDKYNIKPIIGVIPDNCDKNLMIDACKSDFWKIIIKLHNKGWIVAQHGFKHEYTNNNPGILNINNKSEFSGLPYSEQYRKISLGKEILWKKLGFEVNWWMAPAHSLDNITCKVLKKLGFAYITDGIALWPFKKYSLTWIPQQIWWLKRKYFGCWTICVHPNHLNNEFFIRLNDFCRENSRFCLNLDLSVDSGMLNVLYKRWWYFQYWVFRIVKLIYEKIYK